MTVDQLEREEEEQKSLLVTPSIIGKRLMSVRVSYGIVLAVVCWFAFAFILYFLRLLGFLDGR